MTGFAIPMLIGTCLVLVIGAVLTGHHIYELRKDIYELRTNVTEIQKKLEAHKNLGGHGASSGGSSSGVPVTGGYKEAMTAPSVPVTAGYNKEAMPAPMIGDIWVEGCCVPARYQVRLGTSGPVIAWGYTTREEAERDVQMLKKHRKTTPQQAEAEVGRIFGQIYDGIWISNSGEKKYGKIEQELREYVRGLVK